MSCRLHSGEGPSRGSVECSAQRAGRAPPGPGGSFPEASLGFASVLSTPDSALALVA